MDGNYEMPRKILRETSGQLTFLLKTYVAAAKAD